MQSKAEIKLLHDLVQHLKMASEKEKKKFAKLENRYKTELKGRIAAEKKVEQYAKRISRLESQIQQADMNTASQIALEDCSKGISVRSPGTQFN